MASVNTHAELLAFYMSEVQLPETKRTEMRTRRNSNRQRLARGLRKHENPRVIHHLIQGSYAMHTMIQRPGEDYDIDDGACFDRDDLKGPKRGDKTALGAREMVCAALGGDESFSRAPENLPKCVRVFYAEGYHIDVPVYREWVDDHGVGHRELAAADWIESDPQIITEWFTKKVSDKSPEKKQPYQMRRLVCLLKAWASSRASWNLPNGLIFSVLTNKLYSPQSDRDDQSFHLLLKAIKNRLESGDKTAPHPVSGIDEDFATGREAKMDNLLSKLSEWLPKLAVLDDPDCTKNQALLAWNSFFSTQYFDQFLEDESKKEQNRAGFVAAGASPGRAVKKGGDRTFG